MDPIALLGATVGLTQVIKDQFKLEGASAVTLGVAVGLVLKVLSDTSELLPEPYKAISLSIMGGLLLGLTAVGLYRVGLNMAKTANPLPPPPPPSVL